VVHWGFGIGERFRQVTRRTRAQNGQGPLAKREPALCGASICLSQSTLIRYESVSEVLFHHAE